MMESPGNKFSLREWVKHPTTILLFIAINVVWILIFTVTGMAQDKNKECMEQVMYLRDRVTALEEQVDTYTTATLIQRGVITRLTDSLSQKVATK